LFGCDSLATTPDPRDWTEPVDPLWDQLRQNPEAKWIGLAAPPFLVRPVYGLEGIVARTFDFTESVQDTADLLRGNPAFLCGVELTRNFAKSGWGLRPSGQFVVENVPLHTTEDGWASPVTQVLSQSAASRVSDSGLIPVLGYRNDSVIRVPGVRSVAKEENDLKGWWSSDR
jgi:type VI secretion system protein ImpC